MLAPLPSFPSLAAKAYDIAVDDPDSGTDGPEKEKEKETAPRPISNDGKTVRVWKPAAVDKPLPPAPEAAAWALPSASEVASSSPTALPDGRRDGAKSPSAGVPPPPSTLGTEVAPGSGGSAGGLGGGGGKKRGFSSIRKKASSLLP
jgi:hypothetical protein